MSKTTTPVIEVTIRRDANTITPTHVAPHELTLLRQMFGKENVQEGDTVGSIEIDADTEHERLSAKYGFEKVAKVYGDDNGERLRELVEKHAAKPEKPKKDAKAEAAAT